MGISTGGHAWYVAQKNMKKNELIVVPKKDHPLLFTKQAMLHDLHWICGKGLSATDIKKKVQIQVRYRQKPENAVIKKRSSMGQDSASKIQIEFTKPVRAVAPGQSAVIYRGQECLGGGVIS